MSNWTVYTVRCSPMMEKRITIRRVTDDQVEREHSTVKTKTRQSHDIYLSGLLNRMAFSFLSYFGGGLIRFQSSHSLVFLLVPFPKRTSTSLSVGLLDAQSPFTDQRVPVSASAGISKTTTGRSDHVK